MSVKPFTYPEHCSPFPEHPTFLKEEETKYLDNAVYSKEFSRTHNKQTINEPCYSIKKTGADDNRYQLITGYYIGVDWIVENQSALYVEPKLNSDSKETDYIKMLFSCLSNPEVSKEINDLFIVKWDEPAISITQKQDLLTPFLVVEFITLLKSIVRKGLKKSYYKVENNLSCRVKGKVMVSKTIKHNTLKNKQLNTFCAYDEFGINNKENRLLNKALTFVKRYLPSYHKQLNHKTLQDAFNYINPAFTGVSTDISLNEIKQTKTNVFYQEYEPAIKLAKLILKRFGYNISNTVKETIQTPPFWIDMSKLFELYVLGLLKERFHNQVQYQFKVGQGNELDYILKSDEYKMVIDAKYIPKWEDSIVHENVRQISGYTRLKKVYQYLFNDDQYNQVIKGLIIYPLKNGTDDISNVDLCKKSIEQYYEFYKLGVKLPHL